MAQRPFIADFMHEGTTFDETFLLAEKELRTTKAGKLFIRGTLQDRTGTVPMICWEATERFYQALPRGGFVRARGRVELYQNRPQVIIEACIPVDDNEVDLTDFLPATTGDVNAMEAEVREALASITDPAIKAIAEAFLEDTDLMTRFVRSPAAKVNHHAYLGGLLEHTAGMMRVALQVLPLYPVLNRDLMVLGIFLHDIGKTEELSSDRSFEYTDSGRLVGHLVQGAMMVDAKVKALRAGGVEVPDLVAQKIIHLILAHHGEYAYGSPKLPVTAEAVTLHYLDNLDAKLTAFAKAVDTHPAEDESWTSRQFMFDNQMLFRGTEEDRQRLRQSLPGAADAESDSRPNRRGGID